MAKRNVLILVSVFIALVLVIPICRAHTHEMNLIKKGDFFPENEMPVPADPQDRNYLGLPPGSTSFTLKHVKADLILVEILSVYCSSCQMQAPYYNKLYELLEKDPLTRGRIKIMGIAAGNGEREINHFRRTYTIAYPIIPDPKFILHRAIGGSRTPFAIYVLPDPSGGPGTVAGTHLGLQEDYKRLSHELKSLMNLNAAAIRAQGLKEKSTTVRVQPIFEEEELVNKVKAAFREVGGKMTHFEKLTLPSKRLVFTAQIMQQGPPRRIFAEVVSRAVPCDVCHDIHFIYLFDESGTVIRFVPLQVTKYGNEPFDQDDLDTIRERVLGRFLSEPFIFDSQVDAVSSATITSAVIFDSLAQGKSLLRELREKGLMKQ